MMDFCSSPLSSLMLNILVAPHLCIQLKLAGIHKISTITVTAGAKTIQKMVRFADLEVWIEIT